MLNSNEILAPIGARRGTSLVEMVLKLMIIIGVGMLPSILDKYEDESFLYIAISLIFIAVPVLIFFVVRSKEITLSSVKANKKPIIIMPMLSNIGLVNKLLALYREKNKVYIEKLYLLKTSNFPASKDESDKIINLLKGYIKDVEILRVKHIDNPKELQLHIDNIAKVVDSTDLCAVNIISGKASTSVILYELAHRYDIEVHYMASEYDRENNPVDGTERLTTLKYEYLD